MMLPNAWGAADWWLPVAIISALAAIVIAFSYRGLPGSRGLRVFLSTLKVAAIGLLAFCLVEPMYQFTRPEPGANLMLVMADDSQSLQIKDRGETKTRGQKLKQSLNEDARWLNQLAENFDVRRYQFDRVLRPVANFSQYESDRRGTDLVRSLRQVTQRFDGRPAAGVIMLTDGNDVSELAKNVQTDNDSIDWSKIPPIYPVIVGDTKPAKDIGITRVVSTQTNFETSPVTINAELVATGFAGQKIAVELLDETGELLEKKEVGQIEEGRTFTVRFKTQPKKRGVNVFQLNASLAKLSKTPEATIVNNKQSIVVNRGRGPFRVLYVCGRPNWELKFLRRAMVDDREVDFVSLVRIAKREAKFSFRGRAGQKSNSLFRGFESQDEDTTEQYDQPVFLRLGTRDKDELRGGFPKEASELFEYDGIVLDDVEAAFFSEEQKTLLQQFVSLRGGGVLMLGGKESFGSGGYDRTQIGEMMPVYLDRLTADNSASEYRLDLTREGWLQPWIRVQATEKEERKRLDQMPGFRTINRTDSIKPGATVLATVSGGAEKKIPSLVVQPFGKGRTAAMLIGDFWRWHLRTDNDNNDMQRAWRQMMRWLVSDIPRRVELSHRRDAGIATSNHLEIRVKDEAFVAYDNATIELRVEMPDGKEIELSTTPSGAEAGVYLANLVATTPGVYRAVATVSAADGSPIETREIGWVCDPDRDEFQSLVPNRQLLEKLAEKTGGEVIRFDELESLAKKLESKPVPISQQRSLPWWHRWLIFGVATGLLVTEWGIRRWKGLP